jgi:hypothetical protein
MFTFFLRYVQPATPIYDLTPTDAIVHGRFFYASSTSQLTSFAIVHSFVLRPAVNQSDRFTFLRRLMAMWLNRYQENPFFNPSSYPHVPNIRTEDGLKDIMAIGNILQLAPVMDRRCYLSSGGHWTERVEMAFSRSWYRQLQTIIAQHFVLSVEGKPISPYAIFQRSLVEFAAAVVVYKEDMSTVRKITGFPPSKVKDKMVAVFQTNYPELLPKLHSLIKNRVQYLYWTGPKISITERIHDHLLFQHRKSNTPMMINNAPQQDFSDSPLYIETAPDGNTVHNLDAPQEPSSKNEKAVPESEDEELGPESEDEELGPESEDEEVPADLPLKEPIQVAKDGVQDADMAEEPIPVAEDVQVAKDDEQDADMAEEPIPVAEDVQDADMATDVIDGILQDVTHATDMEADSVVQAGANTGEAMVLEDHIGTAGKFTSPTRGQKSRGKKRSVKPGEKGASTGGSHTEMAVGSSSGGRRSKRVQELADKLPAIVEEGSSKKLVAEKGRHGKGKSRAVEVEEEGPARKRARRKR